VNFEYRQACTNINTLNNELFLLNKSRLIVSYTSAKDGHKQSKSYIYISQFLPLILLDLPADAMISLYVYTSI